jgi:hypothetical protein
LGAACCIYLHGEKVVDLWGGVRNRATGEPWQEDQVGITVSFPADGKQYKYCWIGFNPSNTYWFEYTKKNDGLYISAAGNVQNH